MQLKFFVVPALCDSSLEESLNTFLRAHRVVSIHRELVRQDSSAYWALCIEYLEGAVAPSKAGRRERVDYKDVLNPDDFALYAKLRECRRVLAESEAVPLYAVCTNDQLAAMAQRRMITPAGLQEIKGFGEAKAAKYGTTRRTIGTTTSGSGWPQLDRKRRSAPDEPDDVLSLPLKRGGAKPRRQGRAGSARCAKVLPCRSSRMLQVCVLFFSGSRFDASRRILIHSTLRVRDGTMC